MERLTMSLHRLYTPWQHSLSVNPYLLLSLRIMRVYLQIFKTHTISPFAGIVSHQGEKKKAGKPCHKSLYLYILYSVRED